MRKYIEIELMICDNECEEQGDHTEYETTHSLLLPASEILYSSMERWMRIQRAHKAFNPVLS